MKYKCYMNGFRELIAILSIILAFVMLTIFLQYHTARFVLHLELESDQPGKLTVFWKKQDEPYSIKKSRKSDIQQGTSTSIKLNLPPLSQIDYITVFPIDRAAILKLTKAVLTYDGREHTDFLSNNRLPALENQHLLHFISNRGKVISIESLEKDSYFEIPVSIRVNFIFKWIYWVYGSILLTLLFYFLLNQRLLKGSQSSGFLQITLPAGHLPQLPKAVCSAINSNTFFRTKKVDEICIYHLSVMDIKPQNVLRLVALIRESNPEAEIRFQYNRSGETS